MVAVTLDSLLHFLNEQGYKAELEKETEQVFTTFTVENREFPLFLRIFKESSLLQFILFIPCPIIPSTINDVARLLHLLNKEVDMPGFGLDEISKVIFYRQMVHIQDGQVDEKLLSSTLEMTEKVIKIFTPTIEAIAQGLTTLDDVLKKVEEASK